MLRKLVRAALVIPEQRGWGTQALGPGSVVDVLDADSESPIGTREVAVRWVDVAERVNTGWIARTSDLSNSLPKHAQLSNVREDLKLSAVDRLRDAIWHQFWLAHAQGKRREPWSLIEWCSIFGPAHLPELRAVARDLGVRLSSDEPDDIIRRVLRPFLNREVDMSEIETAREGAAEGGTATKTRKSSAKKSTKKSAGKKASANAKPAAKRVEAETSRASMGHTTGAALVPMLKKAKADGAVVKLAERLAADETLSRTQLEKLRDAVNEAAATAREKEHTDLAAQLSSANRLVRRLARKA
jgi:hypothetical protein